jgi:predicted small secreted protein
VQAFYRARAYFTAFFPARARFVFLPIISQTLTPTPIINIIQRFNVKTIGALPMRIITVLLSIVLSMSVLTGCKNTIEGVGQDMQSNGKSLEKSVKSN